jgi:hypothetical protein
MSRRTGPTLAERSRAMRADAAGVPAHSGARRAHCWVQGPIEDPGPWPGLIIEWARAEEGWRARVVYTIEAGTSVERWFPATELRPA